MHRQAPRAVSQTPPLPASVEKLVLGAQEGQHAAFEELYNRFHRVIHATVLVRVNVGDADDIVQDVFTRAWLKLHTLQNPAAFPGWLITMARNCATDHQRKSHNISETQELSVAPPPVSEALAALRAIKELPHAYAETLAMRLIEGLTGPEIAERTGMKHKSVRINLHRGFKLLRDKLGGER